MNRLLFLALISAFVFCSCTTSSSNPADVSTIAPTPTLLSPGDAASGVSVAPGFNWNSSSTTASYPLQASTNSSFSSFVCKQAGIKSLTQQVSGLNPLSIYYWIVSASNNVGTSGWSTVWSLTTTGPSPAVPLLLSPAKGALIYSAPLSLNWIASSGAASYSLQVSGDSSFANFIYNQSGITTSNQQVTGLSAATYYWRVSATNNYGTSGWSTVWSITTNGPTAPFLSSPVNGAINVSVTPTLNWTASSGASSFALQVSANSSFTSMVYNQTGFTTLNQPITGLTTSTQYYWRLSATNSYCTSG